MKQPRKRPARKAATPAATRPGASAIKADKDADDRTQAALDLIMETLEALRPRSADLKRKSGARLSNRR